MTATNNKHFIGLAVFSVEGMTNFCFNILKVVLENHLRGTKTIRPTGGKYDRNQVVFVFEVEDWRVGVGCIRSAVNNFGLLAVCGIYRHDFDEGLWRHVEGGVHGDFDSIVNSIDLSFSDQEQIKLKTVVALLEARVSAKGADGQ
ncbi:MAG: hypothetical protein U1F65_05115 [Verrucomicrobiota bacterium]